MKRFLDEVLDALSETHDSFEDLIFILPNKRAGTFLINALGKKAKKTAFAPRIISIEEMLEEISGLKYASQTLQLFELYQAYLKTTKDPELFHEFLNWAGLVLQDFNEIDRYMVDPEKLFAYLSDIHEIKQWGIEADSTSMVENYLKFWKELYPLYVSFSNNLSSKGYAHAGGIYRKAAENTDTYLNIHPGQAHVFIGFNALTEAESNVIQKFLRSPNNMIFWDIDRILLEDTDHDASFFMRQYEVQWERLKEEGMRGISTHYSAPKTIHAIGVPKRVSQAQYVGKLLEKLVSKEAPIPSEVAVVLGDESLLNPMMHSMPESVKQMNITMGFPLEKIPLAAFFKQILAIFSQQERTGWPVKSITDFWDQPYFFRLFQENQSEPLNTLRAQLNTSTDTVIRPGQIRCKADIDGILPILFPERPLSSSQAIQHVNKIIALMKAQFDSGNKRIELEYLHGFYRVFNQLSVHIGAYSFLSDLQSLLPLYDNLLQIERIDLRGEPLQGLQIMGMLETRVLDYETVIITSVNEGILPAGKTDTSLIPFDVKREFGLPTYKEKDAIYTYHFYRLLQRAKNIYLVYNTEPDVLIGGEKSRLIMQLQADPIHREHFQESLVVSKDELVGKQVLSIPKTQRLMEALGAKLKQGISPTLLSAYIRDPMEFYKKAILNIQDSSPDSTSIEAMTLGTLTHKSAEALYKPLKGQLLSEPLLLKQKNNIPEIVESQFKETFPQSAYFKGKNYLAYHVVLQYLNRLLDYDIQAAKHHQITLLEVEKKLSLELSFSGIDTVVQLIGVADRIDRYDNHIRVIDYKTGGLESYELNISSWEELIQNEKRQKAFQVLSYALMVGEQFPGSALTAGIISFKNMNKGFVPFGFKTGRVIETGIKEIQLNHFKEQLGQLIKEICNKEFPFEERLLS